jgi:hypothetical protein
MTISNNSKLREIYKNTKVDEQRRLFLEGIIFIIDTIDKRYELILHLLEPYAPEVNDVMRDAWIIADNMYRLKLVIDNAPGIDKSTPSYQLITRKLSPVEPLRHFIEHYDHSLQYIYRDIKPVVGHLGYLKLHEGKKIGSVIIIPGSIRKFQGLGMVNSAGKQFRNNIDHITLYLGDDFVDISDIYYHLGTFVKGIESYISENW